MQFNLNGFRVGDPTIEPVARKPAQPRHAEHGRRSDCWQRNLRDSCWPLQLSQFPDDHLPASSSAAPDRY